MQEDEQTEISEDVEGHRLSAKFRPDEETMFGQDTEGHRLPRLQSLTEEEEADVEGHGFALGQRPSDGSGDGRGADRS